MTKAHFDVGDESIVVAVTPGDPRRIPNRMAIEAATRRVVAIGDVGETEGHVVEEIRAFDARAFDAEMAAGFVQFWSWKAISHLRGLALARSAISPTFVEIMWPSWLAAPLASRREFLRRVVTPFGWVSINGRRLASWGWTRSLLMRRGPWIEPDA